MFLKGILNNKCFLCGLGDNGLNWLLLNRFQLNADIKFR
jgi:hypothetical protein